MTTPGIQHYVWQHYLEAWENDDGLVHCSRNQACPFATNPRNLMAEHNFYEIPHITRADANILKGFAESAGTEELRQAHRNLIDAFAYVTNANELIKRSDISTSEEKTAARNAVIELEDMLHGQIERNAHPLLAELREKRAEFIHIEEQAINFFRFIAHQYFRTKRIRSAIMEEISRIDTDQDLGKLANLVCHMAAENVGASLFVDRNEFDLVFLTAADDVGFITGDQPIVNLVGTGDSQETTDLVWYYPLKPNLACLVVPKEYNLRSVQISGEVVEALNDVVAWESRNFLAATSKEILDHVINRQSSTRPSGFDMLDSLVEAHPLTIEETQ